MTAKQNAFIRSLMGSRVMADDLRARLAARLDADDLTVAEASKTIDWLLAQPEAPKAPGITDLEAKVPAGRYALTLPAPDPSGNRVHFYIVDKPTKNPRWIGRTFVSLQVSDDKFPVRSPEDRASILSAIADNPAEALLLYGQLIGRCGHCGRTLTNDESRRIGIGPVCRSRDGARWGL